MKCVIKGCNNENKASQLKNKLCSNKYCIEHLNNGINSKCKECGKELHIKISRYIKNENKEFLCGSCSSSKNVVAYNKSDKHKKYAKEHAIKLNASKEGKQRILDNASKYRNSNKFKKHMNDHNKSDKMKEISKNNMKNLLNLGFKSREDFYNSELNCISFKSKNIIININDLDKFDKIPGVWSKIGSNGQVLDIAETKDLKKEILFSLRCLNIAKSNIFKSNDELIIKYKIPSLYIKYKNMIIYEKEHGNNNILFKIIAKNIINKKERQNIELQEAHDTKALFWNLAPGQSSI